MDIIVILIAAGLMGAMGWAVYRKMQRDEAAFGSQYDFDDEGIHGKVHNKPFQFQGQGAQSTRPVKLEAGDYKIRYLFPDEAIVKVELFSVDDGEGELIILKSGSGEAGFTINANGRYLFDVDPQEGASWKLEINRLGLPSGYKPIP
jgi:hypothetical protein